MMNFKFRFTQANKSVHTFFLLIFLSSALMAQNEQNANAFLSEFIRGSYDVIGRIPDADSSYFGRMILVPADSGFEATRTIFGNTTKGRAEIESALHGEQTVLRLRFVKKSVKYEITYLIQSDLDNYPRLSGYVYRTDKKTVKPGMETCFFLPVQ